MKKKKLLKKKKYKNILYNNTSDVEQSINISYRFNNQTFESSIITFLILNPYVIDEDIRSQISGIFSNVQVFENEIIPFYKDKILYATLSYLMNNLIKSISDHQEVKNDLIKIIKELNQPTRLNELSLPILRRL